jgi:prophage maintenance system killer protein
MAQTGNLKNIGLLQETYKDLLERLDDTNFRHFETADLVNLHSLVIKPGEPKGIYDHRGLDEVVKAAKRADSNLRSVWYIAATYMYEIAYGQVFKDGNKRTAALAGLQFLNNNGFNTNIEVDQNKLYDLLMGYMGHDSAYTIDRGERLLKALYPTKTSVAESKISILEGASQLVVVYADLLEWLSL